MTSNNGCFIGFDLGGTKLGVGTLDFEGRPSARTPWFEIPALVKEGPERTLAQMREGAQRVLESEGIGWQSVLAIGLGSPGPADLLTATLYESGNLTHPEWQGFPIRKRGGALFGELAGRSVPFEYDNDGNQACRWEASLQADLQRSYLYLGPGTGIGGGLWINGSIWPGERGQSMEIGHFDIPHVPFRKSFPVPICPCGKVGHAEGYASLAALAELLKLVLKLHENGNHPLCDVHASDGEDPWKARAYKVRELAEDGDPLCREIYLWQAARLGHLAANVMNILDVYRIILGAGYFDCGSELRTEVLVSLKKAFKERAQGGHCAEADEIFILAQAGDRAGAYGAALQARQSYLRISE